MTRFAKMLELPVEELRQILRSAEAPERLRAAWAIALRSKQVASRPLLELVAEDVPDGLRQHLVVVLAGLGERSAVLEIAVHDPHAAVRAVASAYTIRTAPSPADTDARSFALRALRDGASEIRATVLHEVAAGRLWLDAGDIQPFLAASDAEERRAALLALVTLAARDQAATRCLVTFVDHDGADELIQELDRADALRLVRALKDQGELDIDRVLAAISGGRVELGWGDLDFLLERTEPAVANALLRTTRTCPPGPSLPWLVQAFLNAGEDDPLHAMAWFYVASSISEQTVALLPAGDVQRLRSVVQRRRDVITTALAQVDPDDDFFDDVAYYSADLEALERVAAALEKAG